MATKPTTKKAAKKKPNKQHDVRGSTFVRLAARIRKKQSRYTTAISISILEDIAECIEAEGKATRRLR